MRRPRLSPRMKRILPCLLLASFLFKIVMFVFFGSMMWDIVTSLPLVKTLILRFLPGLSESEPPLRVYLLPIPSDLNFDLITKSTWLKVSGNVTMDVIPPIPPYWNISAITSSIGGSSSDSSSSGKGKGKVSTTFPGYPELSLHRQHGAEYFLALSLLSGLPSIQRVANASDAEVIFVPFFSSLAYHTTRQHLNLQKRLSYLMLNSPPWEKANGSDFVLPALHPYSVRHVSNQLPTARFLAVDFDHSAEEVLHSPKDIITPYVSHMAPVVSDGGWKSRPTLLFFRGTFKRWNNGRWVREGLAKALSGEEGVVYHQGQAKNSSHLASTQETMRRSKFCLSPEGDSTSSCRFFDAIMSGCIPVVVSDNFDPPFEDFIDYTEFAVFVPIRVALQRKRLITRLRRIDEAMWTRMWERLSEVRKNFVFSTPAKQHQAEDMIWRLIRERVQGRWFDEFRRRRKRLLLQDLLAANMTQNEWVIRKRGGK